MEQGPDRAQRDSQADFATVRRLHPGGVVRPPLDRLSGLARRLLATASSQVSLISDVASTIAGSGLPPGLPVDMALSDSLCTRTAAQARPLVLNDTRSNPDTEYLPPVVAGIAGSYLGVPLRGDDRSVVGALCVFDPAPRLWTQDDVATLEALAEAVSAELELAALARDFDASRARWDVAIDAAGVGSFDWDLRTGQLSWDERLIALFGYDDVDVFEETIEAFNARLHPDDVPAVGQALQHAIDTLGDYEAEYRVVLPDGRVRQVQARGRALGERGVAERVLGAAWDVTATRSSEDHAARLVEAMPVAYLRIDGSGTVLATNQLAERLLHTDRFVLLHRVLWDAVPEAMAAQLSETCAGVLATGVPSIGDVRFGPPIDAWFELQVWPDGDVLSLFFTDITARRRAQDVADALAAHDREVATTLQQALLTTLPEPDHLELRARYVPAAVDDQVGGDWYDAIIQPDGATSIVVGDVAGHDITAAATMGQLRSVLRALLWQDDDPPATVMAALDRAMADLYPDALATALIARIEQSEQQAAHDRHTLRWTSAGHFAPLLIDADGTVVPLDGEPDLMLGVRAGTVRTDHVHELPSGCTLIFYTDGLVERRGSDLSVGLDRLAASLRQHHRLPVDVLISTVLEDMLHGRITDDVVLLAARIHPRTDS